MICVQHFKPQLKGLFHEAEKNIGALADTQTGKAVLSALISVVVNTRCTFITNVVIYF